MSSKKLPELTFDVSTHRYYLDGKHIWNVTSILKEAGLINFDYIDPIVLERAGKFGRAVHKMCELWDKNNLDVGALSKPLFPYLEAWKKFLTDYKPEILEIEQRVWSPTYMYAGTPDRIVIIDGVKTVLDIKSTATTRPTVGLQIAGYRGAYNEMNPKAKAKARLSVNLMPTCKYKPVEHKDSNDWYDFLGALKVVKFKERYNLIDKRGQAQ